MESLLGVSSSVRSSADFVDARTHPEGLQPLLCYSDQACLYASPTSPTGYFTCDNQGSCKIVEACEDGYTFSGDACVKIADPCGRVVDHEVYKYASDGSCAPSGSCETDWIWNGTRCEYVDKDKECDVQQDRVYRFDAYCTTPECLTPECTKRDECKTLAFSSSEDRCVPPNTQCADPLDNRLQKYNDAGDCAPANECVSQWELVDDTCLWGKRGKLCDPTPEEVALDDKRVFEFDAQGACIASNRCVQGWSLGEDGVCGFDRAGEPVTRRSGRQFVYNNRQEVIPAGCIDGYSLVGDACLFNDRDKECSRDNNEISKWSSSGQCVPTRQCVSNDFVYKNGCVPKPKGCPSGFRKSGSECYRSFNMGGEGRKSISFSADPSHQIRAKYTFRKNPRYNDGDYSISSNFGLGGGQGGIRGSHSRGSGWTSGRSHYTFNARQNDGNGTLEVWLRSP